MALGLSRSGWLTDPNIALYSVMFANAWAWWGFLCILFLTGLGQIDEALYEAARVDGASQWKMFRRITLPLLRPTLVFVGLLTTLWSFTTFDYPYVMTQGGPAHSTDTLATWMYFNLVNYSSAGYASAIAVCTTGFLLVVIAAYVYTRLRGVGGLAVTAIQRKKPRALQHPVAHGILLVLAATALAPICILVLNSLRSDTAISGGPLGIPASPIWSNYPSAWSTAGYSVAFRNSLIVSASTVAGVCTFAGLAAYGLARIRARGSGAVLVYLLIGLTLPAQLFLTPLFIAWVHLHLNNSLFGLIFIYWGIYIPFGTLLLRSFFISLSPVFEEAARVDGCSELQVFGRIVVPMAWPAIVSLAVIVAVWSWNEFFFAVTFLTNPNVQTVAVRYYRFLGIYSSNLADISVGGLVVCCVPVLFFILLQRRFVQGLAAGGLKG